MAIVTQTIRIAHRIPKNTLKHARIAYRNLATSAIASSWLDNNPPDAALSPNTYEFWKPEGGQSTLTLRLSDQEFVDCVCLGAHTLGSTGSVVTVATSTGLAGPWEDIATIEPGSDIPLMLFFQRRNVRSVRLSIAAGGNVPQIGVALVGASLTMQRMIYGGVTPITMARATDIRPNYSETGQFLGRRIVSEGIDWQASWSNLTPSWYRENFEPFAKAARTLPFFIAWRPETYPNEAAYGWTTGDITPSNMGVSKGLMSVGLSMRGVAAWEPGDALGTEGGAETIVTVGGVSVVVAGNVVIIES